MAPRIGLRVIAIAAAVGLLLQSGWGQGRGGATSAPTGSTGAGTTPTGTTGTSATTNTGRTPTTTTPTNPTTTQPTTLPQPIFLSGRVLLEDGSPPPESVVIERVCGGSPHAEGYTDSKGYFGIQLGQSQGVIQDASESNSSGGLFGDSSNGLGSVRSGVGSGSGAMSEMRYMNCDLQAKLAGFRSQAVNLANRRAMDNPDVGIILLHRMIPTEGTTISASSLAAPKDARKAYDKGMDSIKKKKWEDAAKSFEKATELYPGYASAWYELGRLQAAGGAPDTARISFECAAKADPKYTAPLVELAGLDVQAKKWQAVAATTEKAIRLDSFDYPELFFFNAAANYYLRNAEAAEKNARQALRLDTQHRYPQSAYLLGLILAAKKDLTNAAEQFRAFLKLAPESADAGAARQKLAQIEQITAQGFPTLKDQ